MAHPNLVNVTNIVTGYIRFATDGDQGTTENLVSNVASSGKLYRITNFTVYNKDSSSSRAFQLLLFPQDDYAGTSEVIIEAQIAAQGQDGDVYGGNMPQTHTYIKATHPFYLHEDRSLRFSCGATDDFQGFMCWEEITDA